MAMARSMDASGETHTDVLITVKFDSSKTCSFTVNNAATIGEVKELVGKEICCLPSSLNLVFAGQLLHNDKTVEDYRLIGQTTLHAFPHSRNSSIGKGENGSEARNILNDVGYNRFFVFCKVCDNVNPGKLRVCCLMCGSPLFLVHQGPSNWQDISSGTTVRGECKNQGCNGDVPRFYMKCFQFHKQEGKEGGGTAVALKHVQANRKHVECIVCQEVTSPVLIFPCPPGHVICLDCFRQYASTSLNSRQFVEHETHGYTLPCPSGDCEESHIEDNHHFYLMGKNEYERFKNFGAEEYVLQHGGVLCPGPGCGMGIFPDDDDTRIKCTECQFVSCKLCSREFHMGSCEESLESEMSNANIRAVDNERAERASWDRQSLSLIEVISKPCPTCKVKTQYSGGCMHMSCSRCHTDWCWFCVKPWDRKCQEDHWFG